MKTYMFPGQGSQSKGMGGTLFDEFKELTEKADKILGYSIKELCLENPKRELNKTQFTQPALYVVNALSYYKKIKEVGKKPDFVVGHSLGEFNALLAAECFDFEAGLKLVKKRGELMSQATDGGMAAILNATKEQIEEILKTNGLNNIDLANYNTPSQIVISGPIEEIGSAEQFFQQGEILYYPLNTSGAFHSRFMEPSKEKFKTYLKKFKFSDLKIPVISNVTAQPYKKADVLENLSSQMASGVRWSESIQYLMEQKSKDEMDFEEVGHGDVLTKIVATIKREVASISQQSSSKEAVAKSAKETANTKQADDKKSASSPTKTAPKNNQPIEVPKAFLEAEAKVEAWNKKHPVGTKVKSTVMDYDSLETRTEAVVLFGHRAAVYMKDYNGYFDLNEITPA
ncbi:ACP S-malonyltransferase [Aliikangiella coralliicola]|uniref:[acyl-carrier-protein] S-malonyltransferase n=1 Tax=Aliikangiella coralliicola TaxID=2592383 RepID=A0A545U941_9GAMM|nr:ACP S-malonyltransferase [Aliikangiella coralliicola]TQV85991.1 ACP S-malonyltransferase [Aliikangiella coralliicola]